MSVALLPTPPVMWDVYVAGPWAKDTTVAATAEFSEMVSPAYSPETVSLSSPRPFKSFGIGGTGVVVNRALHRGVLAIRKSTTSAPAIDGFGGVNIAPITDITGLGSGFINPSFRRVQWLTWNLAMEVGTLDRNSGILCVQSGGTLSQIWPIAPATAVSGGLGIVGDGAGNWNFESYDVGAVPWTVLESVSLAPALADPEDFHTFDMVFISGSGSREAAFQLLIDGVLFLERNWVDAIALAPLPATSLRWAPIWQVATTTGDRMWLQSWEYKMGRFLPDGRELFE